ncbi:MAG TPA: hypothetical protein PK129_18390 [Cellvibrionaceae bacterium]|nr:hypothetical protein [Cellvibrionaceae bacterium]
MTYFVRTLVILAFLVLAGCAQTMRTQVNSFRAPEPLDTSASVAVLPSDQSQAQSLEFNLYKSQLEQVLVKQGFVLASPEQAQLRAVLAYSVNRVADSGDGGVRTGVMVGSNRGAFGSNVMILDNARKSGWYERKVSVVLERNGPAVVRLYEINGQSEGGCGVLSAVMPDMFRALFSQFPMENGVVKFVSVPVSQKCQ